MQVRVLSAVFLLEEEKGEKRFETTLLFRKVAVVDSDFSDCAMGPIIFWDRKLLARSYYHELNWWLAIFSNRQANLRPPSKKATLGNPRKCGLHRLWCQRHGLSDSGMGRL